MRRGEEERSATRPTKRENSLLLKYLLGFLVGIMMGRMNSSLETFSSISVHEQKVVPQEAAANDSSSAVFVREDENTNNGADATTSKIDLPLAVKDLIINIGSNLDPVLPDPSLGPCARTIAVEPIVGCMIIPHPQLDILSAAIAGSPSIATMQVFNRDGVSSSLASPAVERRWNNNIQRGDGQRRIVPVVSMKSLLLAIPDHVTIPFLKTDMQGFDFEAVSSAGHELLAKVPVLQTEVWKDDIMTYAAHNDLCRDWYPFMTKLGYDYHSDNCRVTPDQIASYCQAQFERNPERPPLASSGGLKECDALWVRKNHTLYSKKPYVEYKIQNATLNHRFTDEEYQQCK